MLERLSIAPAPLVQANLRSVAAVCADAGALLTVLGAAEAAALLDAAQRATVTPIELEVAAARLAVGERLGAGSFGTVHAARLDGGDWLALKRVSLAGLPPAQRDETLRAAAREVRALSRLVHPHVVRLHGVVIDEAESIGMLIELAPRGSLRDLLDNTPAEVVGREAVQMELAKGIAAAMAFLHAQAPPVLHHDVKSANILVFDTGAEEGGALRAKLTDFGLSLTASGSSLAGTVRAGGGTVAYQAPEQFDGTFTAASEVYSFAIILWELLHGGRPWDGKTPAAIIRAVDRGQRLEVTAAGDRLHEVMCDCWAAEPSERPTFVGVGARLATASRTFETSAFKRRYAETREVTMQHTLWAALHGLVSREADRRGVPQERADAALLWVQRNAFTAGFNSGLQEALDPTQLRKLTARVWSSAAIFEGVDQWPCSLLQAALRADDVEHAAVFARALNSFVVVRNQPGWLRSPLPARTYRGGSLPRSKHFFFFVGQQYRQPMFISSTADVQQAHNFMQEQGPDGSLISKTDAVLWTFVFDPQLGCNHINLIDRHDGTLGGDANQVTPTTETHTYTVWHARLGWCCHVTLRWRFGAWQAAEDEWLFAPYSFFTVEEACYKATPTWTDPHRIVLRVAPDNKLERTDVPNAPWG